jgi:hypothetical protein
LLQKNIKQRNKEGPCKESGQKEIDFRFRIQTHQPVPTSGKEKTMAVKKAAAAKKPAKKPVKKTAKKK